MSTLVYLLEGSKELHKAIIKQCSATEGVFECHTFPDGESYLRLLAPCQNKKTIILCGLDQPNKKIMPLILLCETLKEMGASEVGLVAPYLAYMRQDKRFKEGEGITSVYFAKLLSRYIDWLVTVDPHLHRYSNLNEIYTVPTHVAHAAPVISAWIKQNIEKPLLIGPDRESEQWVSDVAQLAHAPFIVLQKHRLGDHDVQVSVPQVAQWQQHTPVLVDDIISTGQTLIETIHHLHHAGMRKPVCIGVHGLFSEHAYEHLIAQPIERVISTNTILHESNQIDISGEMIKAISNVTHRMGVKL